MTTTEESSFSDTSNYTLVATGAFWSEIERCIYVASQQGMVHPDVLMDLLSVLSDLARDGVRHA